MMDTNSRLLSGHPSRSHRLQCVQCLQYGSTLLRPGLKMSWLSSNRPGSYKMISTVQDTQMVSIHDGKISYPANTNGDRTRISPWVPLESFTSNPSFGFPRIGLYSSNPVSLSQSKLEIIGKSSLLQTYVEVLRRLVNGGFDHGAAQLSAAIWILQRSPIT